MEALSAPEAAERLGTEPAACLLDVREPWELEIARVDGSIDIPMDDIPNQLDSLRDQLDGRELIVMCHGGVRSAVITRFLTQNGFDRVFNLTGGIQAWSMQVDSNVPTY